MSFAQQVPPDAYDPKFVKDLWDSDKPAAALSNRSRDEGVYEEVLFGERMAEILQEHDPSVPLFLSYFARIAHYPVQAPIAYQQRPNIAPIGKDSIHRMVYHAGSAPLNLFHPLTGSTSSLSCHHLQRSNFSMNSWAT